MDLLHFFKEFDLKFSKFDEAKQFVLLEKHVLSPNLKKMVLEGQLTQNYNEFRFKFIKHLKKEYIDLLVSKLFSSYKMKDEINFEKYIRGKVSFVKNLIESNSKNELIVKLCLPSLPEEYREMVFNNLVMEETAFLDRAIKVHQLLNGEENSEEDEIKLMEADDHKSKDDVNKKNDNIDKPPKKRGRPKKIVTDDNQNNEKAEENGDDNMAIENEGDKNKEKEEFRTDEISNFAMNSTQLQINEDLSPFKHDSPILIPKSNSIPSSLSSALMPNAFCKSQSNASPQFFMQSNANHFIQATASSNLRSNTPPNMQLNLSDNSGSKSFINPTSWFSYFNSEK